MEIIDWLNTNSGSIIALATVILAIITYYYVHLTREALEENRQIRLDAQKPEIVIRPRRTPGMPPRLELVVQNIGRGPARNVKFTIDHNFRVSGHESLRSASLIKYGIDYLQPVETRSYRYNYDKKDGYDELIQTPLNIKVTYQDFLDNEYAVCWHINFREIL